MDIHTLSNIVFLLGSSLKAIILIPTLRDKTAYVPRTTSITTMLFWFSFATCYWLLNMPPAAIATYAGGFMWMAVVIFKGDSDAENATMKQKQTEVKP